MATYRVDAQTADEILKDYERSGFRPEFTPGEAEFITGLYRRLAAKAEPVSLHDALSDAAALGLSRDAATRLLEAAAERGAQGEIRGLVGLSLNEHPHHLKLAGRELRTWCALDPLFIVRALGQVAEVESRDPQTGQGIRVFLGPSGLKRVEPTTAVMSLVVPLGGFTDVEGVWMQFCQHVHFFVSEASAIAFLTDRPGDFRLVSIQNGFEVARRLFECFPPIPRKRPGARGSRP